MATAKPGLTAAKNAAKEPVGAAQAEGGRMSSRASNKAGKNEQAVQIEGPSPLPPVPSGVNPRGEAYDTGELPGEFNQIRQYLNILYPFTTPDPEDAYWQRRSQLVQADGVVPGMGKAIVPPEYFDYVQRKLNQTVSDEFKTFIFQQIDLSTPAAREWWETRFPEYTNEFRQGWKKRLGHMARMGDMLINGVQSTDDLWYLFITEKGLNPVAYQYQGPPNSSQIPELFNMYQQTLFPLTATESVRSGPPFPGTSLFGQQGEGQLGVTGQNYFTGQTISPYGVGRLQQPPAVNGILPGR